ncbi:stress responsive a b barrel domain-containing protein [Colletotrichum truncatum]|uniref:Stress responsive a b barrel domain-containing protein n=1 Tax=Colletotrichum truncatum TaxID=5467 RepID=A0ACC3YFA4_COLTU|nr:stress responsive a b barrel domain-containing protein [Colletotrichum truncatum]KAF6788231.1 stress responsive a b barrel domain-containing protein [Colletotrichum truncatum]
MSGQITRITLFKIPDEENQKKALSFYQQMPQKAVKNGKPYILSVKAGLAVADQRAQGFTVAAVSTFASAEDMAFYDNECAAHAELKAFAKGAHEGFAMVYFKD